MTCNTAKSASKRGRNELPRTLCNMEALEARKLLSAAPLLIQGTAGDDVISVGLQGSDYVVTLNGTPTNYLVADVQSLTIYSLDGNDTITLDASVMAATIDGGYGDDNITGGGGADFIRGDGDDDTIIGGGGNDTIMGNTGNDDINGSAGDDVVMAGLDADTVMGSSGNDTLYTGDGRTRSTALKVTTTSKAAARPT